MKNVERFHETLQYNRNLLRVYFKTQVLNYKYYNEFQIKRK